MLASVGNFLHRLRRKFLFTGVTVGGIALLSKYAELKLLKWQEESTQKILLQQRRKTHYERTLNSTRVMLLELMPNLRKVIEKEIDTEKLVKAIKEQPVNKRVLWKELVPLCFARTICSIVSMSFAAPVAHVIMMVLSSHTLDTTEDKDETRMASPEVQAQYLACFQNLVEEQISVLVRRVVKIVTESLGEILLNESITLSRLEVLLQRAALAITSDKTNYTPSQGAAYIAPTVLPWSQYLKSPELLCGKADANKLLRDMYLTTLDILSTDDFSDVVNTLIQVGVNYVLDEFADNKMYVKPVIPPVIEEPNKLLETPQILSDFATHVNSDGPPASNKRDESDVLNSPHLGSTHKLNGPISSLSSNTYNQYDVTLVGVPFYKISPVLSGMLKNILPDPKNVNLVPERDSGSGFYNRLVVCSQLEALSFNVYDALMINS